MAAQEYTYVEAGPDCPASPNIRNTHNAFQPNFLSAGERVVGRGGIPLSQALPFTLLLILTCTICNDEIRLKILHTVKYSERKNISFFGAPVCLRGYLSR